MDLRGEKEIDAPRAVVWDALASPERMVRLMPGVSEFEVIDDTHWRALVRVPVGLGGLKMNVECEKAEERPLKSAVLRATGRGLGATMSMTTLFVLSGEGERTSLQWDADVQIGGRVSQMGQRVLEPIIVQQVEGVLDALESAVRDSEAGLVRSSVERSEWWLLRSVRVRVVYGSRFLHWLRGRR